MVQQRTKAGAGSALVLIAMLLVSQAPLNLEPADIRLPELSEDNVYADKSVVKQGEPVTVFLSDLLVSDAVGIIYFVFDFHDQNGLYYIDRLVEHDTSVTHVYNEVGQYHVTVLAMRGNHSRTFTVPIEVIPEPVGFLLNSNVQTSVENSPIQFFIELEDTNAAEFSSVTWDFGDGSTDSGTEHEIDHTYTDQGTYHVRARVYTVDNMVYTRYTQVVITNQIPSGNIISDNNVEENTPIEFEASVSETTNDVDTLVYVWNFGDGSYGLSKNVEHIYHQSGTFTVEATIFDNNGAIGMLTKEITVINRLPQVLLSNEILGFYEGETVVTTATVNETENDFTSLNFDWNAEADGIQASVPIIDDGQYVYSVNVTDDDGAFDYATTNTINAVNVAPIVSLVNAYSEYTIDFAFYGTVDTKVNIEFYLNDTVLQYGNLTSYSTNSNEANTTSFSLIRQHLSIYADILYTIQNTTANYDNYLITTFNFDSAPDIQIVNHCEGNKPCSPVSWRDSVSPIDRGFPLTMEFEYFDPGADNLTVGIDFGLDSFTEFIPHNNTANFGNTTIVGALPPATSVNQIKYWAEDDDGARAEFYLPIVPSTTVPLPDGYLNQTSWVRTGNLLSHYAPGALISLSGFGYNSSRPDDRLFEGNPQYFYAQTIYSDPASLNYEWHWGDGSPISAGRTPVHMYKYSGEYLLWVKIFDGTYSSVAYQIIEVQNRLQTYEPVFSGLPNEGEVLDIKLIGLIPDDYVTSKYFVVWDFGDGRKEYGLNVSHIYEAAGTYDFTLKIYNEHFYVETFSFELPINGTAPYVEIPLPEEIIIGEGNNANITPRTLDSAFDSLGLTYNWTVNGQNYYNRSLSVYLPDGNYSSTLKVTDNDGISYVWDFVLAILPSTVDVRLDEYAFYGRTLDTLVEIYGSLSPVEIISNDYQTDEMLGFQFFAKNGTILDFGNATFIDSYNFKVLVNISQIYDETTINSLLSGEYDDVSVSQLLRELPNIVSGDYDLQFKFSKRTDPSTTTQISVTADEDGDLLADELEIILDAKFEDVDLDLLVADTNDNGITDTVEFLIADDEDLDGLPSILEDDLGTDPRNPDTDGDGLADGWGQGGLGELAQGSDPLSVDTDEDTILDLEEVLGWDMITEKQGSLVKTIHVTSSPIKADTDGDGLDDYFEFTLNTDPRNIDTDGDRLSDGDEQKRGTSPLNWDSDGDNIGDWAEINILRSTTWVDVDGNNNVQTFYSSPISNDTDDDGIADTFEIFVYHSIATSPDSDRDYVLDFFEIGNGTNIIDADTDNDQLGDGVELNGFIIPVVTIGGGIYDEDGNVIKEPTRTTTNVTVFSDPLKFDTDGDSLSDGEEILGNNEKISDPTRADSDGDGLIDSFDAYPLISDYAPPTFVKNVEGEDGLTLTYKVGDNSLVENVKKTFKAALDAIWGLLKDVGTLLLDLIAAVFYWKCLVRIFGTCIIAIPWVRSVSEIKHRASEAITRFVDSSSARLAQVFDGVEKIGSILGKVFDFSQFSISVNFDNLFSDPKNFIQVNGFLEFVATTGTRFVKALIDPSVNVKFTVVDDNMIDEIRVYQDGRHKKTIDVNAQSYNFDEDFSIISDEGDVDTNFRIEIEDRAGNIKVVERSDSIINFIENIVNVAIDTFLAIVESYIDWAIDIFISNVQEIFGAATDVYDRAVEIYEEVQGFLGLVIPTIFETFVRETVGKYLESKYNDSQSLINSLFNSYQAHRSDAVTAIDSVLDEIDIENRVESTLNSIGNFFTKYLPGFDEESLRDGLNGVASFLNLDFLDGTIFEYVIDFLKDEFASLLQKIIKSFIDKIVNSVLGSWLEPLYDIYYQVMEVADTFGISLSFEDDASFGETSSINVGGIDQVITTVLNIVNVMKNPSQLVSPIFGAISGENMMKIVDVIMMDNPNLLLSINDIFRGFMTPFAMLGLVIFDVLNWVEDIFSPNLSLEAVNKVSFIFNNLDANNIHIDGIETNQDADLANKLSMIHLIMKGAFYAFDLGLGSIIGLDRSDDSRLIHETVSLDYMVRLAMWIADLSLSIGVDAAKGNNIVGDSEFKSNGINYALQGLAMGIKGIFLKHVLDRCTVREGAYQIGGGGGYKFSNCKGGLSDVFTPNNYDGLSNLLDIILTVVELGLEIAEFESSTTNSLEDFLFGLSITTKVIDAIYIPLNYITSFGILKVNHPALKAVYYGIMGVNQILKFVGDFVEVVNDWQ